MEDPVEFVLDQEWQLWIAENLLRGAAQDEIRAGLEEEGLTREEAQAALESVGRSPTFHAAFKVQERALRAEMILRLERERSRSLVIETMRPLDAPRFQHVFRAGNRPLLLPDFASKWPARTKWSFPWMAEHFGAAEVQAMFKRSSDPDYDRNHAALTSTTTLGEVIARIEREPTSNDYYVVARDGVMRGKAFASLHDDIVPPEGFFSSDVPKATALWLGPGGTVTPLHHDQSDILFTQIVGRKRVRLISPAEIDVAKSARGLYGPALESFADDERLKDVRIHDLVLAPGDTLFLPMGWWHHLTALEPSISIAINAFEDSVNPWYSPGSLLSRERKTTGA